MSAAAMSAVFRALEKAFWDEEREALGVAAKMPGGGNSELAWTQAGLVFRGMATVCHRLHSALDKPAPGEVGPPPTKNGACA